ncbi:hypothetical protein [Azospirillum doebereinerae]
MLRRTPRAGRHRSDTPMTPLAVPAMNGSGAFNSLRHRILEAT